MSDISTWYKNMPRFTKYWLTGTVACSLFARFGLLPASYLILESSLVCQKLQLWRLVTALFFYPLSPATGFHFMLNCYFLYNYSVRLESDHFKSIPSDYLFLLLFNWVCCALSGLFFHLYILMDPMVLSVLYVWCQLNKDVIVQFWFGTKFKAMYLPWVLLMVNLILSGGGFDSFLGIMIGHIYYFLKFKYPQDLGGQRWLETPSIFKKYFPDITGGVFSFGSSPINVRTTQVSGTSTTRSNLTFRNVWGRGGNVLGRD
ncbi:derlin-1 isoform X2 [Condylostylus longicornis]|uniref:derlin-1 isoform X2 n=1 Tax=Condylostylus longicornis TaxID=2530218 RepID=UPI00244DEAA6|nr:derlin-1 isoform X2 [Condylostylus longicornis]